MTKKRSHGLRESFVTGLFALLPLLVTLMVAGFLANFLWDHFFSLLVPSAKMILEMSFSPDTVARLESFRVHQVLAVVLLLGLITIAGFVARRYIGRVFLRIADRVLSAIPGVNFVHGTITQFVSTMDPESPQRDAFRQAVLVRMGRGYLFGFMTNRGAKFGGENLATVFLPCNQLIQGYNMLVPEKDVIPLDMHVDEAFKYVISFGMAAPHVFQPRKLTKLLKKAK